MLSESVVSDVSGRVVADGGTIESVDCRVLPQLRNMPPCSAIATMIAVMIMSNIMVPRRSPEVKRDMPMLFDKRGYEHECYEYGSYIAHYKADGCEQARTDGAVVGHLPPEHALGCEPSYVDT